MTISLDKLVRFVLHRDGDVKPLTKEQAGDIGDENICLLYHPSNYGSTRRKMVANCDLQKCKSCYDPYNVEGVCQGFKSISFYRDKRKGL